MLHHLDNIKESPGGITFGDFMEFLSVMSKGTTEEKILWSFDFLDIDKNGYISKQEMLKVGRGSVCNWIISAQK